MITIIRKRLLHNKSYKIVVWAIGIILAVSLGLPGVMGRPSQGTWIAQVNGQELGYNDFVRKVYEQEQQLQLLRKQYGQYADLFMQAMGLSLDPQALAFDSLVREELLNQAARSLGTHIHSDYIQEKLADTSFLHYELSGLVPFHAIHPDQGINMRQLQQHLQRSQLTLSDFDAKVAETLQRNLIKDLIVGASYTPLFEQKEHYIRGYVPKQFSILTFSLADLVAQEKTKSVTAEQLQAFFIQENAQSQRYAIPEKRAAMVWKVDPAHYGITITDEELKAYFEAHKLKDFIAAPAKISVRKILLKGTQGDVALAQKAQALHAELVQNPTLFAKKAQEVSDDKATAHKGGVIAPFARGTYDSAFERVAFGLKNDGDIAPLVSTAQGYEIIQRVSKVDPQVKSFNSVKKEIQEKLLRQKFSGIFTENVRDVIEQRNEISLKEFLTNKKAQGATYAPTAKESSKISEVLFSSKKIGDISYFIDGNQGVIVELIEVQKTFVPGMETIKTKVQQDYYEAQAGNRLREKLVQGKAELATHSLKEVGNKLGAHLKQTEMISKNNASKFQDLPVETMLLMEKEGLIMAHIGEKQGYLIRLDALAPFEASDFDAKKSSITQDLAQEKGQMCMGGFVASLYRTAKIKQNESLFNLQKEYSI